MYWFNYLYPVILFVIAPAANGVFLATGLRGFRQMAVPLWWWVLMSAACAMPIAIVALGYVFAADRPRIDHQDETWASQLLSSGMVAALVALPLSLLVTTDRLSDRRGISWRLGLTVACLALLPLYFLSLLAAAQMVSGVSL